MTRWNLTVDDETDRLVRTHLAERGLAESDLSDFVGRAVRRAVFWSTVDAARDHNADAEPAQIEAAVDEALSETRRSRATRA